MWNIRKSFVWWVCFLFWITSKWLNWLLNWTLKMSSFECVIWPNKSFFFGMTIPLERLKWTERGSVFAHQKYNVLQKQCQKILFFYVQLRVHVLVRRLNFLLYNCYHFKPLFNKRRDIWMISERKTPFNRINTKTKKKHLLNKNDLRRHIHQTEKKRITSIIYQSINSLDRSCMKYCFSDVLIIDFDFDRELLVFWSQVSWLAGSI